MKLCDLSDAVYSGNPQREEESPGSSGNCPPILTWIRVSWADCYKWTGGLWLRVLDSEALESLGICICNTFLENVGGAILRKLL